MASPPPKKNKTPKNNDHLVFNGALKFTSCTICFRVLSTKGIKSTSEWALHAHTHIFPLSSSAAGAETV